MNFQNNDKKKWALIGVATLVVYVVFKLSTGHFGPVPLRVNISNSNLDNIVVKLTIRGAVAPLKGGHEMSRYTLHGDVKLVKANEPIEFPRAYMWMALDPVEYIVEVYHPALYSTHKVVKISELENSNNIPLTEINAVFIGEMINKAKQRYSGTTQQEQKMIKTQTLDALERTLIHTRDKYVPFLKESHKNPDQIYQQVKQLHIDCEQLFATFDYKKDCYMDKAFLKRYMGLVQ